MVYLIGTDTIYIDRLKQLSDANITVFIMKGFCECMITSFYFESTVVIVNTPELMLSANIFLSN